MTSLPALLTIAQAAKLAGMTPKVLRRRVYEWSIARDEQGKLRYPNLRHGSRGKWLIQKAALREALGGEAADLEVMLLDTAATVDNHERRLARLEGRP
jgi:hypothetical protein